MKNFLTEIIDADLASGKHTKVVTRFPPEPNGYLHIGHAKSILLNYGLAKHFGGDFNLRFDDTNPEKEEQEYVDSISADIRWLGADYKDRLFFASDYFERMYAFAEQLIQDGKAYVDEQSVEEIRENRGNYERPGVNSPFRDRPADESLAIFRKMRAGDYPNGSVVLRAKIDMTHANMVMRDPLLYRVRHAHHHRQGDAWCIYPMYDYAHCLEDAEEGITHSICTLEFENNRELYDWIIDNVAVTSTPRQFEFARLKLDYTVMSKRKLRRLVEEGYVSGWDDPRMPTVAGMRRAGVTPEAIQAFAEMIGVAKTNSNVDIGKLEYCIRNDLNHRAPRRMCVLDPLVVQLTNVGPQTATSLEANDFPDDVGLPGTRTIPFESEILIERADFAAEPPKGWRRMAPGWRIRLRYGYVITCDEVVLAGDGSVERLLCSIDHSSLGQSSKAKGTIHWVPRTASVSAEIRLYDRLFKVVAPGADGDFIDDLNPDSLTTHSDARVEPAVAVEAVPRYQFERTGYFARDSVDSAPDSLVFNRTVGLRDSWSQKEMEAPQRASKPVSQPQQSDAGPNERELAREADVILQARYEALVAAGVGDGDADVLAGSHAIADYFDKVSATSKHVGVAAKWVVHGVLPLIDDPVELADLRFGPASVATIAGLVVSDSISATAGKTLLAHLHEHGGDATALVDELGLRQVSSEDALGPAIRAVVDAHPDEVARYRDGKTSLIGFFVGKVMRETGGKADPGAVRTLLSAALEG